MVIKFRGVQDARQVYEASLATYRVTLDLLRQLMGATGDCELEGERRERVILLQGILRDIDRITDEARAYLKYNED